MKYYSYRVTISFSLTNVISRYVILMGGVRLISPILPIFSVDWTTSFVGKHWMAWNQQPTNYWLPMFIGNNLWRYIQLQTVYSFANVRLPQCQTVRSNLISHLLGSSLWVMNIIWNKFGMKRDIKDRRYAFPAVHSCQIRQIADAHAPGMPGTFSPPPRVSDPDIDHGTCVTHVPWCMPGSLAVSFEVGGGGKRSRHSRCMHKPQCYVSGKRSMLWRGLCPPFSPTAFAILIILAAQFTHISRITDWQNINAIPRWKNDTKCGGMESMERVGFNWSDIRRVVWLIMVFCVIYDNSILTSSDSR